MSPAPWYAQAAMEKQAKLSMARLREVLSYDPLTGVFTRLSCPQRPALVGQPAGCEHPRNTTVTIDKVIYAAHRLAHFYKTGKWPVGEVDHRDGNPHNNIWLNLRDGDRFQNQQNLRRARITNQSGLLGAHSAGGRFSSKIRFEGRSVHLGYHDTAEGAHHAYVTAKRSLHAGGTI